MFPRHYLVSLCILILLPSLSFAKPLEVKLSDGSINLVPTGPSQTSRTVTDSVLIMGPWGSGAPFNGQFQDQAGNANWNDWTHRDLTIPEEPNHWHASTYNAEGLAGHGAGNLAAWCGTLDYSSCNETDPQGGYGNSWNDHLAWTAIVADTGAPSVITIDAWVSVDSEPDFDYLMLLQREPGAPHNYEVLAAYDGVLSNQHLTWEITIPAGQYSGLNNNMVDIRFAFQSDGAWSDEDCLFFSAGACQIDDISVHLDNGNISTFDDFEGGGLGNWVVADFDGSGDFSQLRTGLGDMDPCHFNDSPQACFIDDGVVVPGTGGTRCVDYCYGPGGYIVNNTRGLGVQTINNNIISPIMPWPSDFDGGLFEFDVYVHERLEYNSPTVLYYWKVRSTSSQDPSGINVAMWRSTNWLYYGEPEYRRHAEDLSPFIVPEATYVQVALYVYDYDPYNWEFPNGSPAPYFDNVRVVAATTYGPEISLEILELANDAFPETGILDAGNLANNSVRFDSCRDEYTGDDQYLAQDFITVRVDTKGEGTSIESSKLHYRLIPNPVFDAVRTSGLPNIGSVEGTPYYTTLRFDLPDTAFFYPGDIIHYYFTATQSTPTGSETSIVPADTSGFSENPTGANSQNPGLATYNENFIVRALPVVNETMEHAKILIWDDACDTEFTGKLRHDLNQAQALSDFGGFDLYRKTANIWQHYKSLDSAVSSEILAGYSAIFYFSGKTSQYILGSNGNSTDLDFQLLADWLETPDSRGMFVSGDYALGSIHSSGYPLAEQYLGVDFIASDAISLMDNSVNPEVIFSGTGPLSMPDVDGWFVSGYCPDFRMMDAVQSHDGAVRLGEFADPSGQSGAYPYSAMTAYQRPDGRISFSLPYDFGRIQPLPGWSGGGLSLRSQILLHIASFYTDTGIPNVDMTTVPDPLVFSSTAYPNPFNPSTTINFTLPRSGDVSLKIYNIRGELVNTLVDEVCVAGHNHTVWSGEDRLGNTAASGVYFYELRFGNDVLTEKLMLIK